MLNVRKPPDLVVAGAWVLAIAVAAVLPRVGLSDSTARDIILICIMALAVSGLNLNFGYAGELNLAGAAVYASGAYLTGYVAKNVINDVAVNVVLSILAGLVVGLIAGVPGLRMSGWVLAVISFFVVLLVSPVVNLIGEPVGGFSGLTGIPLPGAFGHTLSPQSFYLVVVVVTGAWFALFRNFVQSRHGNAVLTLKESSTLTSSLGISPYMLKLRIYAVSAIPAGIAGCFFSYLDGYIAPESFSLDLTVTLLAASLLGGMVSISGALIGSTVLVLGPGHNPMFATYALVAYGAFLLIGGVVFSDGIVGMARRAWLKASSRAVVPDHKSSDPVQAEARDDLMGVAGKRLEVRGVSKKFGGVPALQDVSLVAHPGQVSAVIGPNGSGKTTTLNIISGFYSPDSGDVVLGKDVLTGKPVHKVSRAGAGRTFQTPVLPADMTVWDIVAVANFDRVRNSLISAALRSPRFRSARRADDEVVRQVLQAMDLLRVANTPAGSLALGTRRMVELARAVVRGQSVILLDEVAAGLDEVELEELSHMIRALRRAGATIVLVEHNFTFVRAVADTITVLSEGAVIAQGSVESIMADAEVLSSYLGEGAEVTGTRLRSMKPTELALPEVAQ